MRSTRPISPCSPPEPPRRSSRSPRAAVALALGAALSACSPRTDEPRQDRFLVESSEIALPRPDASAIAAPTADGTQPVGTAGFGTDNGAAYLNSAARGYRAPVIDEGADILDHIPRRE